mmetsp:Transcript_4068/g.3467  ORF Transcript_4068/g.3467 Transcript_4068/m.3467 type:complete len:117 (-) Transcript_4068:469-819(-)
MNMIIIFKEIQEKKIFQKKQDDQEFKTNFLINFSNELRSPLNANLNLLEQVSEEQSLAKNLKDKFIGPALTSAKQLSYFLSDIHDYSMILKNKLNCKIEPKPLDITIRKCLALIRG